MPLERSRRALYMRTIPSHRLTSTQRTPIFVYPNKWFFSMTRRHSTPQFLVMTWLALLLIGVITGDFVEDLAFEPAELSDSAGTVPTSEEPDEHVLMPSQRADQGAGFTFLHVSSPAEGVIQVLPPCTSHITRSFSASLIEFNTHPPPCFLLPLRI
jgi:hypothetical protein